MGRLSRYIKEELNKTSPYGVWLCGGALLLAALLVRATTPSPYLFVRGVAGQVALPPTWLLGLFWFGMIFLVGLAWGLVLGRRGCNSRRDAWRFRGTTYLLLSVVFALLWYRLLFGAVAMLLSWCCLLVTVVFCVLTALSWWRISPLAGGITGAYALWSLFLFVTQFVVILYI